ncbi:hypothetical protein EVAR_41660_1 [Eumeta japonica]|uniref:Uncharacterized protein n=1 Tax=Eumeta variegata TaxID=151549 RepID=A0A4C1VPW4_EUMVA|nr:hypothetical protein EVAR_41660_1 [Eumeta japonica]
MLAQFAGASITERVWQTSFNHTISAEGEIDDIRDTNENPTSDTEAAPENATQNFVFQEQQQQPAEKQPRDQDPVKNNEPVI